jgi:hypothetical protein
MFPDPFRLLPPFMPDGRSILSGQKDTTFFVVWQVFLFFFWRFSIRNPCQLSKTFLINRVDCCIFEQTQRRFFEKRPG